MPYRTALVPEARVATIPPNEASAPRIDGEVELCADVGEMRVSVGDGLRLLRRWAISVVWTDTADAVHFVECDAKRAFGCDDCALQRRCLGTIRDDRYLMFCTDFDQYLRLRRWFSGRRRHLVGVPWWYEASRACASRTALVCAETCSEECRGVLYVGVLGSCWFMLCVF